MLSYDLDPPTPLPVRIGSPRSLSFYSLCVYSLAVEGLGGWPQIIQYDSTETLVLLYIQYSPYGIQETNPLVLRVEDVCWFYTAF